MIGRQRGAFYDVYPDFLMDPDAKPRCAGTDLTIWFDDEPGNARAQAARAKQICSRCPLLHRCRSWALSRSPYELYGIWGGLTHYERVHYKDAAKVTCERCGREVRTGRDGVYPARHKRWVVGVWRWCG